MSAALRDAFISWKELLGDLATSAWQSEPNFSQCRTTTIERRMRVRSRPEGARDAWKKLRRPARPLAIKS